MKCPKCRTPMHKTEMETVSIHECPQCNGIWFDQGGLDRYLDTDPDIRWLNVDFWKNSSGFEVLADVWPCPKCNRYYLTRLKDHASATSVAVCNNCRGIWAEADQLRSIIQAITRSADNMDSAAYLKESLRQFAEMIAAAPDQPASHWRDLKAVLRMLKYRIYSENPELVSMLVGAQKTLPV